jgi:hypothetical protein
VYENLVEVEPVKDVESRSLMSCYSRHCSLALSAFAIAGFLRRRTVATFIGSVIVRAVGLETTIWYTVPDHYGCRTVE